jgi:hypothetical protein
LTTPATVIPCKNAGAAPVTQLMRDGAGVGGGGRLVASHASRARAGRSRQRQSKWAGSTRRCTRTALVTAPFPIGHDPGVSAHARVAGRIQRHSQQRRLGHRGGLRSLQCLRYFVCARFGPSHCFQRANVGCSPWSSNHSFLLSQISLPFF